VPEGGGGGAEAKGLEEDGCEEGEEGVEKYDDGDEAVGAGEIELSCKVSKDEYSRGLQQLTNILTALSSAFRSSSSSSTSGRPYDDAW
jgi:hypothetical protein